MAFSGAPENPFFVVPVGRQCITNSLKSWRYDDSATYVFAIPYDSCKPLQYITIHLRDGYTFDEGQAAILYGHTVTNDVVMGDRYYIGDLGPDKMSAIYQVSPTKKKVTCITLYITTQLKSEVDKTIEDINAGRMNSGANTFIQLPIL
jgi:hypothetical protein